MSLSINKLLNLAGINEKEKMIDKNPDFPDRYNKVRGLKKPSDKNHNYDAYEFDQFNLIMRPSRDDLENVTNLHLNIKNKLGTQQPYDTSEGWFDPAQKRRTHDPNKAPPFDFTFGSEDQKFGTDKDEMVSHNNEGLVKMAHTNYMNYMNRYNVPSIPVSIQK